jgi:predicted PurR-regulated permease PerM
MLSEKEPVHSTRRKVSYPEKVWQTLAIIFLFVAVILILRVAFSVLLMGLAGVLIAVYFHGLAAMIERKTRLGNRMAMIVSVGGTIIIIAGLLWFIGAKIQMQVTELSNTLPQTISTARTRFGSTPVGKKVLEYSEGNNSQKLLDTATAFFNTSFGVLGDLYIIIFLGIFFTASPTMYKNGLLLLVPKERKLQGVEIIDRISCSLRGWLKGMMLSMVLITILITIGLTIMGIPVTMVLGLITGILEIVPNFGPLIAMIPGVLLASTISTNTAIVVALMYIAAQTIVANIATPLLQKKIINLPPALTLMSQLIMGALSGVLGIILAVPLLAILVILIDELYLKKNNTGTIA